MTNEDPRVTCQACAHNRGSRCHKALAAGLSRTHTTAELGRTFATTPQHCSAYRPKESKS